ncbi:MAG TPA: hypothetical protein VIJ93_06900, partial [bacterium]
MKLTDQSVEVLSNFSTINKGIVVSGGDVIKTMSPGRHILAEATLDVAFPKPFAIHDLKLFLNVVDMFTTPDIDFEEQYMTISDKDSQSRYLYSPSKHVEGYSEKGYPKVVAPTPDVKFELSQENLEAVQRAGSVMQMPHIAVAGVDGKQKLVVYNSASSTSDTYERNLGDTTH